MSLENGYDPDPRNLDPRLSRSSAEAPSDRPPAQPGGNPGASASSQFASSGSGTTGPGFGTSGYTSSGGDGRWRERSTQDRRSAAAGGRELMDTAKAQASGLLDYARSSTRSALAGQQQAAAESMRDLAGALRMAGRQLEQERRQGGSHLARHAADTLEQFSDSLRRKDLGGLALEAENFARRQPAAFIGAAMFAGFLAMRFLKSSQAEAAAARPPSPPAQRHPGADNRHLH